MNSGANNDILPSELKVHDCSLVNHGNLQVSHFADDQIVWVFVQKGINPKKFEISSQEMISRPINFGLNLLRVVNDQGKRIGLDFKLASGFIVDSRDAFE